MLFLPILVSLKTNMDSFQSLIFFNIFINDILTRIKISEPQNLQKSMDEI